MFAAVAQRIKDIGVLRIIGFKRWQVLVSFLLESLLIAGVGGLCGMLLGSLCHGLTATSVLSSGAGGGGKTVILRLVVDAERADGRRDLHARHGPAGRTHPGN